MTISARPGVTVPQDLLDAYSDAQRRHGRSVCPSLSHLLAEAMRASLSAVGEEPPPPPPPTRTTAASARRWSR